MKREPVKRQPYTRNDFRRHSREIVEEAAKVLSDEMLAVFDRMTDEERIDLNVYFNSFGELTPMVYYLVKNVLTTLDVNEILRRQFRAESMEDKKRAMLKVIRRQA